MTRDQLENAIIDARQDVENAESDVNHAQIELDKFEPSDYIDYDQYDDMLNDCNDIVTIGNIQLDPANVLKECDPIAYNEGFQEYVNGFDNDEIAEYHDLVDELDEAQDQLDAATEALDELEAELEEMDDDE